MDVNDLLVSPIAPPPDTTNLPLAGAMPGMPGTDTTTWDGTTGVPVSDNSGFWDTLQTALNGAASVAAVAVGSPTPAVPPAFRPVSVSASGHSNVGKFYGSNTLLFVAGGAGLLYILWRVI